MACMLALKQDIRHLVMTFTKDHERFQILSASVDEITCRFIGVNGEKYVIHANITVGLTLTSTSEIYNDSLIARF